MMSRLLEESHRGWVKIKPGGGLAHPVFVLWTSIDLVGNTVDSSSAWHYPATLWMIECVRVGSFPDHNRSHRAQKSSTAFPLTLLSPFPPNVRCLRTDRLDSPEANSTIHWHLLLIDNALDSIYAIHYWKWRRLQYRSVPTGTMSV